jgi:hypothetical protein
MPGLSSFWARQAKPSIKTVAPASPGRGWTGGNCLSREIAHVVGDVVHMRTTSAVRQRRAGAGILVNIMKFCAH